MTLRGRIILYLVLIHLILGVVACVMLRNDRAWLLAAEVLFAVSISVGIVLVRSFFVPLELIRTGAELMNERDFSTHFREVGQPEMDSLIRIYNRMSDQLREERLKHEEQNLFLETVLTASPTGVIVLDFDGRIGFLNPAAARLLGSGSGEATGRSLEELTTPLASALDATPAGTSRVISAEGSRRLKCTRAQFMDHGFARGFILLEELTQELRASEKAAYQKLIRMMSHEVNNSVGAVVSLLDSCRHLGSQLSDRDRPDFDEAIEVASRRMRNLNAFMNGFAEVVRLPAPDRRPCDAGLLLEDLRTLLSSEMSRRGIRWVWSRPATRTLVSADKNQLEQALANVLLNAMEAIPAGGEIHVALGPVEAQPEARPVAEPRSSHPRAVDPRWRLSIRDSGPGIGPAAIEDLFTPFFSTKKNGRGLGLTLVREVMSQHGWAFGLRNHPAGGAEFWVEYDGIGGPGPTPFVDTPRGGR